MKKIILLALLFFHVNLEIKHHALYMTAGTPIQAQNNCYGPNGIQDYQGGGGFFSWLGGVLQTIGTAVGNAATAVGQFFASMASNGNNEDGESFTGESSSGSNTAAWTQYDWAENMMSDPDYGGAIFGNNDWVNYGLGHDDHYLINNLYFFYQLWQNQSYTPTSADTLSAGKYYITVAGDTTKYMWGDKITLRKSDTPVVLTLRRTDGGGIAPAPLKWKRNDSTHAAASIHVPYDVRTAGFNWELVTKNTDTLTWNPIVVYDKPTVYFERHSGYNGEYGFDDEGHLYDSVAKKAKYSFGYEIKPIGGDPRYFVPWMSLLDSQSATIKIKPVGFDRLAADDAVFPVRFEITGGKAWMNNLTTISYSKADLMALNSMAIKTHAFDTSDLSYRREYIKVLGSNGDTLGKLSISCLKPVIRKAIFVYVNTGSGYNSTPKGFFLERLNKQSHNQIFRKWVLSDSIPFISNGLDTIDLRADSAANPQRFQNADSLVNKINDIYESHKGFDTYEVNGGYGPSFLDVPKTTYIFIFNCHLVPDTAGILTSGITKKGGNRSLIWKNGITDATVPHELGHVLNLNHIFPEISTNSGLLLLRYNIPQGTTKNFMDYSTNENRFYFAQWVDIHKK